MFQKPGNFNDYGQLYPWLHWTCADIVAGDSDIKLGCASDETEVTTLLTHAMATRSRKRSTDGCKINNQWRMCPDCYDPGAASGWTRGAW